MEEGPELTMSGDCRFQPRGDEIVSVRKVGSERVWDIEVEGTHNFIAGHYVNRKTGQALTAEQEK